jgi:hypothetical protein
VPPRGIKNAKLKVKRVKNASAVGFFTSLNSGCTSAAEYWLKAFLFINFAAQILDFIKKPRV